MSTKNHFHTKVAATNKCHEVPISHESLYHNECSAPAKKTFRSANANSSPQYFTLHKTLNISSQILVILKLKSRITLQLIQLAPPNSGSQIPKVTFNILSTTPTKKDISART